MLLKDAHRRGLTDRPDVQVNFLNGRSTEDLSGRDGFRPRPTPPTRHTHPRAPKLPRSPEPGARSPEPGSPVAPRTAAPAPARSIPQHLYAGLRLRRAYPSTCALACIRVGHTRRPPCRHSCVRPVASSAYRSTSVSARLSRGPYPSTCTPYPSTCMPYASTCTLDPSNCTLACIRIGHTRVPARRTRVPARGPASASGIPEYLRVGARGMPENWHGRA
jgi:hypothetical protein